jgi:hypothetical protein
MGGRQLPDYGVALQRASVELPVKINPLFVEDIGRVDEDTYTMSGRTQYKDEWHLASVDFPIDMLGQLLVALPLARRGPIARLLDCEWIEPFSEPLGFTLSLSVTAGLGQLQENGSEQYVPFLGLAFEACPQVTFVDDELSKAPDPLKINMGQEVLVLQVRPDLGKGDSSLGTIGTVAAAFFACLAGPFAAKPRAHGWTCFITMQPHPTGLNLWIGVTAKVPGGLLDSLQAGLESMGTEVNRGLSFASQDNLMPIAHVDRDGTFFLHAPGMPAPPEQLIRNISDATHLDVVVRECN